MCVCVCFTQLPKYNTVVFFFLGCLICSFFHGVHQQTLNITAFSQHLYPFYYLQCNLMGGISLWASLLTRNIFIVLNTHRYTVTTQWYFWYTCFFVLSLSMYRHWLLFLLPSGLFVYFIEPIKWASPLIHGNWTWKPTLDLKRPGPSPLRSALGSVVFIPTFSHLLYIFCSCLT